ncbi:MAG: hypothetical protein ACP5RP_02915, partial [Candidatus Micrarchaeia archaeon]
MNKNIFGNIRKCDSDAVEKELERNPYVINTKNKSGDSPLKFAEKEYDKQPYEMHTGYEEIQSD